MKLQTRSGLYFGNFEKEIEGNPIRLFVLTNSNGVEACLTNFGARLVSLLIPDKKGVYDDVVLGHATLEEYINPEKQYYFGATIGRYANRIANGSFILNNEKYELPINDQKNHLHGGLHGFHNKAWRIFFVSSNEIEFSYLSKDLEEGYPGNVQVNVNYRLTDNNDLIISYKANTDKTTIINLTNHSYFNLQGEGNSTINDHRLIINADRFTLINKDTIPIGKVVSVKETPFNFLKLKPIGQDIDEKNEQLAIAKGYDHNFVLNDYLDGEELLLAADVAEPVTGRCFKLYTNEPGIQFYSGNFLDGKTTGKNQTPHNYRSGFCLEPQHFPDSPNNPMFPSVILKPNDHYFSKCIYSFGVSL
ncbi:aldose epimerase family protein [uncultured Aquimarina sp.]|uniref:aldose epimerase family protein n=1 Tax=uncultured Aquimarina sp. TaxID=575652 RepID=UPI0026029BF1|nr:aldose epimerase family protein [uncultured Aquimarina sp.]